MNAFSAFCPFSEPWEHSHSPCACSPRAPARLLLASLLESLQGLISQCLPSRGQTTGSGLGPFCQQASHASGHLLGRCVGLGSSSPGSPVPPARTQPPGDQPNEAFLCSPAQFLNSPQHLMTFCKVYLFIMFIYPPASRKSVRSQAL